MPDTIKTKQALNSAEKASNAVGQAEDHPSERMREQAEHSLISAEMAVRQAEEAGGDSAALQRAAEQVEQGRAKVDDVSF
ncbi:hypothetical protein SD70_30530 [Gordoniibacillus kamchatkensis]|uniref:Uncharacterized protein n=2 Tax=Gordoniibacillus kamchatkensis TaxID=1590651 RepID=A0ABR5A9S7_9BACL|nr:hypothetical protein SD70_30530 [Paenibacillus sp. VKM B-2647]